MNPNAQSWFSGPKNTAPFKLSRVVTTDNKAHHCLACFPWASRSLHSLWDGHALHDADLRARWDAVAQQWMGAIAVGGTGCVYVYPKLATARPLQVTLPETDVEVQNIAWAISSNEPDKPLLVFTVSSVILILSVTSRSIVGRLRGHGGPITSLAVHPTQPHLFCTTSRDFTARIYDLSLSPVQTPNNLHWLPNTEPSLAGPAHGLHMCEPEGVGIGRCVVVMVGGRSGGHRGAVLTSAFHPSAPMIATGGMDRAVKIWRIPPSVFSEPLPEELPRLAREDKPLFSTDLVHKARVLKIEWLTDDILVSCSAPALMRCDQGNSKDTYWEEGTLVVWQWLGLNRFFPPGKIAQRIMRGTASDWRNSESFKILSAYHLPLVMTHVHIYRFLEFPPMLFIPVGKIIRMFNIADLKPRTPPRFPLDDLALLTEQMHLNDRGRANALTQDRGDDTESSGEAKESDEGSEGGNKEETIVPSTKYPPPAPLTPLFDAVEGWEVMAQFERHADPPELPDITACAMGFGGMSILGIGQNGTLYVWRPKI